MEPLMKGREWQLRNYIKKATDGEEKRERRKGTIDEQREVKTIWEKLYFFRDFN